MVGVESETGVIYIRGPIDHERDPVILLSVIAFDLGPISHTATAHVTLRVLDLNDNAPTVAIDVPDGTSGGVGHVTEGASGGSFIARVTAFDADGGDNGQVTCSVDDDQMFQLVGPEKVDAG
jgi:hypothetical protein